MMEFYLFNGLDNNEDCTLEESGFSGALLTYRIIQGDFLTKVAANCHKTKEFKYMVAIRPYAISPQYLYMINKSLKQISNNRFEVNLISGNTHEEEQLFGGILGDVNDLSPSPEKTKYLVKYVEMLNNLPNNDLDFYISVTNDFVFSKTKDKNKLIVSYYYYSKNPSCLQTIKNGMLSISPILRKTKEEINLLNKDLQLSDTVYFTYEEFDRFLKHLNKSGVNKILLYAFPSEEKKEIVQYVKQYKEKESK